MSKEIRNSIFNLPEGNSSGSRSWTPRYYVSNTGNDALDGLSPLNAWRTIAKVNGTSFVPGDKIGFAKDHVWRETLTIPSSGDATKNVEFGAYGSGALLPIIDGSAICATWVEDAGETWSATTTLILGDQASSTQPNGREVLNTANQSTSGTKVRLTIKGHSTTSSIIRGVSICERNGTTSAGIGVPVRVTFGGLDTVTVGAGQSVVSDEITYTFTKENAHLIHVYIGNAGTVRTGANVSGGRYYTITDNTDQTVLQTPTMDGLSATWHHVSVIEVMNIGAPVANVYQTTVIANPLQVFKDDVRQTKGTSKAALNDHEWFAVGTNLFYRDDSGSPQGAGYIITATVRDYNIKIYDKDFLKVKNIDCRYGNLNGIFIDKYNNILIDYCNVSYSSNGGIQSHYTSDHANLVVSHNECSYCGFVQSDGINAGIDFNSGGGDIAEYNILHHNGFGIECDQGSSANIVRYNKVYSNIMTGIGVDNSDNNLIYGNLVYSNGVTIGQGIYLWSFTNGTLTGNKIWNNTLFDNKQSNILIWNEQTNLSILNNIFYKAGSVTNIWIQAGRTYSGINVDYNSYYRDGSGDYWDLRQWNYHASGSGPQTLAQWQALGFDAHCIIADPLLVDPAIFDFHLQAGSPALGAGVDVGLGETNPNIGAL